MANLICHGVERYVFQGRSLPAMIFSFIIGHHLLTRSLGFHVSTSLDIRMAM